VSVRYVTPSEWRTAFHVRRDDLLRMLEEHHAPGLDGEINPYHVDLHANRRAIEAIRDACYVAEALVITRDRWTNG
jgi:hypothetical protein